MRHVRRRILFYWCMVQLLILRRVSNISFVRQSTDEPNIGRRDDPLIIAWWRCRAEVYRELAPLARKCFCIVATSVPSRSSERIFSKAGQLISARRNRLAAKTVNMVLFLNSNHNLI
jgi:zinc finger BED domain-containing protein 1 (E3 SUMO-protein ligase ZBED1)